MLVKSQYILTVISSIALYKCVNKFSTFQLKESSQQQELKTTVNKLGGAFTQFQQEE